jgi:hypothetical protein
MNDGERFLQLVGRLEGEIDRVEKQSHDQTSYFRDAARLAAR